MDTINEPKKVKARKEHECDYCDKVIAIKEEYTVATYKDYDWSDGMGWQDFHDYMYEEHRDIAIEWWQSNKQN